jgi:magnesium transporter
MAQFVTLEVYDHYQGVLEEQLVLAMFVPILIGTGGNVGSQTVTTIIRAMAVGEAAPRHFVRILGKEIVTALGLGAVMGTLMFARGAITNGREFGFTVGLTVGVLIIWAATVGAMLPLVLSKLRVDPAVVSAPFISSLVDATGLIIYFTVAGLILHVG